MARLKLKIVCTVIVLLPLFGIVNTDAQSVWRQNSFNDFKNGTFLDAGSNCYVSAKGRIQIITRWDFNNDGHLDFILPSGHGHTEKENTYIYLNNGTDINGRSRIELPGGGSRGGVIADFNKDGKNDLAVVNYYDSHVPKVPAWIYFGTDSGFSPYRRTELPAAEGDAIVAGDFNGDSWIDLAVACQYWKDSKDPSVEPRKSFIYWNSPKGFNPENRTVLTFNNHGAHGIAAGDIDGDGHDDLVLMNTDKMYLLLSSKDALTNPKNAVEIAVSGKAPAIGNFNGDNYRDIAVCTKKGVLILKGLGGGRFSKDESILLPVSHAAGVVFSDVDKDGYDDAVVANYETPGGATWTNSYVFYSNGKDFTSRKPLELPTIGAAGVSCGDLNGDGYPEIVFSNENVTNERELLSYVYWNEKGTFRFEDHTQLRTEGSMANTIGDVNGDGRPDVIFFNDEGHFRDGAAISTLYWGNGTRNFSRDRSTDFVTHHIFGFGNADLDDDGNVDLIFARAKFITGVDQDQSGLTIEWNKNGKFDRQTFLTMKTAYGGVRIADINRDGYLDMLGSGSCIDLNDPSKHGFPIFWGSPQGYSFKNRTVLDMTKAAIRGPLLMDLNNDGYLDIAGQVEFGKIRFWWGSKDGFSNDRYTDLTLPRKDQLMYIDGADFNKDGWIDLLCPHRGNPDGSLSTSYIYYGSPNGYSNKNMIQIKSYVPYQNSIADFNKDGWLDIFLTAYGGEVSGNRPSFIYWGGPNGFNPKPTDIETYGSSGSAALDFDGDGWLDLLIADHRKSGSYYKPEPHNHVCPSLLYWGGPNGFSKKNRSEFMAVGPSGLNLRDAGNSYDRGLYEDYFSEVHEVSKGEVPSSIDWKADTPFGTSVHFQVRTSDSKDGIKTAEWEGPNGKDTWYTASGTAVKNLGGKYIQYRARLITPNDAATPYLTEVAINFNKK